MVLPHPRGGLRDRRGAGPAVGTARGRRRRRTAPGPATRPLRPGPAGGDTSCARAARRSGAGPQGPSGGPRKWALPCPKPFPRAILGTEAVRTAAGEQRSAGGAWEGGTAICNATWELQLLGRWRLLHNGRETTATHRQRRLIAALALKGEQPRPRIAGILWPENTDRQAAGSLRTTLWQTTHRLPGLLAVTDQGIALAAGVDVDLHGIRARLHPVRPVAPEERGPLLSKLLRTAELLPGWDEDWVSAARERWTLQRLAALEALAREHLDAGEPEPAAAAARGALDIDPWRETTVALLLESHLAAGDPARALHAYAAFDLRLRRDYGIGPSRRIATLISPLLETR